MFKNKLIFFYYRKKNNFNNHTIDLQNITKIIFTCLIILNLFSVSADSKTSKLEWEKRCLDESKIETCEIIQEIKLKENKDTKIGTAILLFADEIKRNLDVLDKDKKTFTLKETSKRVPMLFFDLPLNVDLRNPASFRIDERKQVNLSYLFCNGDIGCRCGGKINAELFKQLKAGNEMSLFFKVYGGTQDIQIKLSLKGLTMMVNKIK